MSTVAKEHLRAEEVALNRVFDLPLPRRRRRHFDLWTCNHIGYPWQMAASMSRSRKMDLFGVYSHQDTRKKNPPLGILTLWIKQIGFDSGAL